MELDAVLKRTLLVYLLIYSVNISAQKLPNIQQGSNVVANSSIKIDGRPNEWDSYAAFNKITGVYYSIANDAKNLYLVLRAEDRSVIKKIIVGGVSFDISAGKGSGIEASSVTYPFYGRNTKSWYINLSNSPTDSKQSDSSSANFNKTFSAKFKNIGIKGLNLAGDSIISIYNEAGIKVAALFDQNNFYTYELAIPLALLKISANDTKLLYNIRLNGIPIHGTNLKIQTYGRDIISYTGADGSMVQIGPATPEMIALTLPTDFGGIYTILQK